MSAIKKDIELKFKFHEDGVVFFFHCTENRELNSSKAFRWTNMWSGILCFVNCNQRNLSPDQLALKKRRK